MLKEIFYRLNDGVQVRKEIFGLLFYDYRGPRLYFVPSGDLIEDDFFQGGRTAGQLIESIASKNPWPRKWIEDRVKQVLELLEGKGLIYGESIC